VFCLVNAKHLVERDVLAVTDFGLTQMLGHRAHRISQQVRPTQHDEEQGQQDQQS
jgi:hypothetical protein